MASDQMERLRSLQWRSGRAQGEVFMMSRPFSILVVLAAIGLSVAAAQNPTASISNGQIKATVYLPDAEKGFYKGTRFDWSGQVASLVYQGHNLIGKWYTATDPNVLDLEFRGDDIVTGPSTTMVGVPEEFASLPARSAFGWEDAKVGGTFVKIGVGVLRKPDDKKYDHFRLYEIVDRGKWTVKRTASSVEFTQTVSDPGSGYGYVYTKKVSLTLGKPQMVIEHTLRNTGSKPLNGMVYDHNFQRWDDQTPGPDYTIQFAYEPKATDSLDGVPVAIHGKTVTFTRPLAGKDSLRVATTGFGPDAKDYDFRIENRKLGIGWHATGDKPLMQAVVWSIRSAFAVEPFITYNVEPGKEFNWKLSYEAYTLPAAVR